MSVKSLRLGRGGSDLQSMLGREEEEKEEVRLGDITLYFWARDRLLLSFNKNEK